MFWVACLMIFLSMPKISFLWEKDRTINLLTWAATIDPHVVVAFEKETGIKVNISYFEHNEELFVKLYTTKGKDYDLIVPSDYLIEKLIKNKLIKPIDRSKLKFWDRINPRLLGHYFDPKNEYSVPYLWAIYGLGIDTEYFKQELPHSWGLLFDYPIESAKVAMLNVAQESILITAQYLYGSTENITKEKIKEIQQKLIAQKKRVEAYIDADIRSNYMLVSKTCPIVVASSPYILYLMKERPAINFIIPQEGGFLLIDSLVLSVASQKDDLVYQFINYLYRPEILHHHYQLYPFLPATNELKKIMAEEKIPESIIRMHFDSTVKLTFFTHILPENVINNIWISLKTS
jgi:spermidine/putrescine transport system substrate-binding protein